MSRSPDKRSALELVNYLKHDVGLTNAEIANELQRDRRMVTKIINGETSGALYQQTLSELARTGQVTHRPPRRRNSAGEIIRVRTKGGETRVPEETAGRYVPQPKRGKFESKTTYLREGGRQIRVAFPKTKSAKGRQTGVEELMHQARAIAKGQRWGQRRVKFQVTYANGRVQEIGSKAGYQSSDFLAQVHNHQGDALSWLATQSSDRYIDLDTSATPITGVTMTVWQARDGEPDFSF